MINILYAPNVNSGGGLNIIKELSKNSYRICFLDIRAQSQLQNLINSENVFWIRRGIFSRVQAEICMKKMVTAQDKVLLLHNVPPFFRLKGKTILFFQNTLILDRYVWCNFSFFNKSKFLINNFLLKFFIKNIDEVDVQGNFSKNLVSRYVKNIPVNIRPLVYPVPELKKQQCDDSYYLCITNNMPHKNIKILFLAWDILEKWGLNVFLRITVSSNDMRKYLSSNHDFNGVKNITYLGENSHQNCLQYLSGAHALIATSLTESFCLPLYEAKLLGRDVIAPELDYVRDLLDPVEVFNPQSPLSLARAIARHSNFSYPQSEVLNISQFLGMH